MNQTRDFSKIEIEKLRKKLNKELIRKKFIDEETLRISQELDISIYQYMKEKTSISISVI